MSYSVYLMTIFFCFCGLLKMYDSLIKVTNALNTGLIHNYASVKHNYASLSLHFNIYIVQEIKLLTVNCPAQSQIQLNI